MQKYFFLVLSQVKISLVTWRCYSKLEQVLSSSNLFNESIMCCHFQSIANQLKSNKSVHQGKLRGLPSCTKMLSVLKARSSPHLGHCYSEESLQLPSETSNNATPAFVQLGLVGADVVAYIPHSKELLTAELHGR